MARDIEDTLTTRLTLLFNERYGLPEAVTQSFAGGKFLDVFVQFEGAQVVVEAKKGQTTLRKRQAARDADKRLRAGQADVAFALCYPEESTLATLPTDTLTWQIRQDPDATVPWREGTAEDLAREVLLAPQQVEKTNLAARILSNALDAAVLLLNAQERENLARALDLPPKRTKRKGKDGKEREHSDYGTAAKRGLLVIAVAMLFQDRLRRQRKPDDYRGAWPPPSVQDCAASELPYTAFDGAWELILRVDYKPIFETARKALASLPPYPRLFRDLGKAAVECSQKTTGSRHDLVGRIFHRVLDSARYDGSYYTSIAAATLLAELAIEEGGAADPLSLRVCDPACGTGTLLMTAAARLRDLRSDGVDEDEFDRRLVEDVLWGYDINLTAAHLAATTLGMDSPSVKFVNMNIHRALLGWHKLDNEKRPYPVTRKSDNPETYIGSVGFIDGQQPLALWPTLAQHIEEQDTRLHHPPQADLVIMNPPFTRGDIRHDQFSEAEEQSIKRKEREVLSKTGALAAARLHSSGGAFGVLGDWLVKRDAGTLAMVLPTTVLSGAGNQDYRRFLARKFHIDLIVSIHDPERIFFSENTAIGECLLIARRWDDLEGNAKPPTRVINLARNPATRIDALRLAERIRQGDEQGDDFTVQRIPSARIAEGDWFAANFLTPVLNEEYLALQTATGLAPLGDMASIDPAGVAIRQHFWRRDMPTTGGWRGLWHHKTGLRRSMLAHTDTHIAARTDAAARYWDRRGRLLLPMKLYLPLARVGAVIVSERTVGSLWTPAHPNDGSGETEEAWALWLNSSIGLLALLGGRGNRKQVYPDFSMKALRAIRVPDFAAFPNARERMASAFESLQNETLRAFPYMDADPVRRRIDAAVVAALGLDPERVARIRRTLGEEPSVTDRRYGVKRENGDDEAEEAEADGAEESEEGDGAEEGEE